MEKTNLTVLLLSLGAGGETEAQGYFSGAALFLPARAELPNALQGAFLGKRRETQILCKLILGFLAIFGVGEGVSQTHGS